MNKYSVSRILKASSICSGNVRQSSNVHYFKKIRKTIPTDLALQHYDSFYSKVYGDKWQSIRLGLLSPNKYAAIINNFCNKEDTEIQMRQLGAYDIKYVYEKNAKRLAKHREKLMLSIKRKKELQTPTRFADDLENPPSEDTLKELDCAPSSESEFEELGHFLSDAPDSGDTFVNAASMELNLNDFVPVKELKYEEEQEVNELEYFQFYELNNKIENLIRDKQETLEIPKELSVFTMGRNNFDLFPPPKTAGNILLPYYLFDAASVLPVLLLNIQDGDYVADFCAAPGGKSIVMAMSGHRNCRYVLNDMSGSRLARLKNVFRSFLPIQFQDNFKFENYDASVLRAFGNFDKILVDAPCTNDRHSLYEPDNNIFSPKRISERVQMPVKQMKLLMNALRCVKPGGTVVYSTCSLSPIQNDGVVHQAILQLSDQAQYTVVSVKDALRPLRGLFEMENSFKYGTQILPHISSNFGPMYFAKIIRKS